MDTLLSFLGFTTGEGIFWNLLAYSAAIGIIVGMLWEKPRFMLFALGGFTLAPYSFFFLNDILFSAVQGVVPVAAVLQLYKVKERHAREILVALTILTLTVLFYSGFLNTMLGFIGVLGFISIAFGIILLPKLSGYAVQAGGGLLLMLYAYETNAWVFFVLNVVYVAASALKWFMLAEGRKPT